MLPSQNVQQVYVGPSGALLRPEEALAREEKDVTVTRPRRWQQAAALRKQAMERERADLGIADAEEKMANDVIARLQAKANNSYSGTSSTRTAVGDATCRLADRLAGARLTAQRLAGPCITDHLDEQMQSEILSALPVQAVVAAGRTCKSWARLLEGDMSESIWERIVSASSIRAAAAATSWTLVSMANDGKDKSAQAQPATKSSQPYWQAVGRRMENRYVALATRWRTGTCAVDHVECMHTEYVMSMAIHHGLLITGAADNLVGVLDVSRGAPRPKRRSRSGGEDDSDEDSDDMSTRVLQAAARYASVVQHTDGASGEGSGYASSVGASGLMSAQKPISEAVPCPRVLRGHCGQVLGLHAYGTRLASCSADGEVLIWNLSDALLERRHRNFGRVYSVSLGSRAVACGGEGLPVRLYDWNTGEQLYEAPDDEAPKGVTTCLLQDGAMLAAGNSDSHSQLRVWDVEAAGVDGLKDRFSLPPYVKGVRCLCAPSESTLLCGTSNGWVVHVDLRNGKYARQFAHNDCVNGLVCVGPYVISGGDDKQIRVSDARKNSFAPLGSHRLRSVVFSLAADEESIYAGVDSGDVKVFDYSAEANPDTVAGPGAENGGFTSEQKAALSEALSGARAAAGRNRAGRLAFS